jgi:hypothetical protein
MTNWYGSNGKRAEDVSKPATQSMARPGDFPLGSIESRAAARRKAEYWRKNAKKIRLIMEIPRPPWCPPWEECKDEENEAIFTDDPEKC